MRKTRRRQLRAAAPAQAQAAGAWFLPAPEAADPVLGASTESVGGHHRSESQRKNGDVLEVTSRLHTGGGQ